MPRLFLIALGLLAAALVVQDGALSTGLGACALVTGGVAWFESGTDSTRELAVIGTLAAGAAAGRVLFAAVPGVRPKVTVIAIVAGASLERAGGIRDGRARRVRAQNLFLGEGIWTPQQMLGWGACGVVAGDTARKAAAQPLDLGRGRPAVLSFAFSAMMDVWLWWGFSPHTLPALVAVLARGLWFDASHAIGNVVIALAAGPELRRMLDRTAPA